CAAVAPDGSRSANGSSPAGAAGSVVGMVDGSIRYPAKVAARVGSALLKSPSRPATPGGERFVATAAPNRVNGSAAGIAEVTVVDVRAAASPASVPIRPVSPALVKPA